MGRSGGREERKEGKREGGQEGGEDRRNVCQEASGDYKGSHVHVVLDVGVCKSLSPAADGLLLSPMPSLTSASTVSSHPFLAAKWRAVHPSFCFSCSPSSCPSPPPLLPYMHVGSEGHELLDCCSVTCPRERISFTPAPAPAPHRSSLHCSEGYAGRLREHRPRHRSWHRPAPPVTHSSSSLPSPRPEHPVTRASQPSRCAR
eukprot:745615-Hanusia_phi.AAC.2